MIDLMQKGGPLMWLLLGCSILSLAIFLERLLYYHRSTINVAEFLQGIANLVQKKNFSEALSECAGTPGPVARVIHSALIRHEYERSELKQIVQESGQLEVPKLERYLAVLASIAHAAPLIGILGTIVGMIDIFTQVTSASGYVTATELSRGIYQSLITSAAGLIVGIPTYLLYRYLVANAKTLLHDVERGGIEIVNLLTDQNHLDRSLEPPTIR